MIETRTWSDPHDPRRPAVFPLGLWILWFLSWLPAGFSWLVATYFETPSNVALIGVSFALFASLSALGLRPLYQGPRARGVQGAIVAAGLMMATFVFGRLLFPEYPASGPHEFLILVTFLPAVGVASAYACWRAGPSRGALHGMTVVSAALVALFATPGVVNWNVDTALPMTAQVSRTLWVDPIPDALYEYTLTAEPVTREEFERYIERLSLTPCEGPAVGCWTTDNGERGRCANVRLRGDRLMLHDTCGP